MKKILVILLLAAVTVCIYANPKSVLLVLKNGTGILLNSYDDGLWYFGNEKDGYLLPSSVGEYEIDSIEQIANRPDSKNMDGVYIHADGSDIDAAFFGYPSGMKQSRLRVSVTNARGETIEIQNSIAFIMFEMDEVYYSLLGEHGTWEFSVNGLIVSDANLSKISSEIKKSKTCRISYIYK